MHNPNNKDNETTDKEPWSCLPKLPLCVFIIIPEEQKNQSSDPGTQMLVSWYKQNTVGALCIWQLVEDAGKKAW